MNALLLDPETLRPLISEVVNEVMARIEAERSQGRLAYTEEEAAALLGLKVHQLADERRRGRIEASTIVGGRIRYTPAQLTKYLSARPYEAAD